MQTEVKRTSSLKDRTPETREEHVRYFMALPLKEIRKRQDIVKSQQRQAHERYLADLNSQFQCVRDNAGKWDKTFDELREMENDLFEAIDRKCFPEPRKHKNSKW